MTVTAEQVRTRQFGITKFRDGYELDEVDDYLETLAVDLEERDAEKQQLEARIAELEEQLEAARQGQASVSSESEQAEPQKPHPQAGPGYAEGDAHKSSAMLQLALELHDKYVHDGETKRDELVSKGEAEAKHLVETAQNECDEMRRQLGTERANLEDTIARLREFEGEYRNTLRSYIRSQLDSLDGSPEPAGAPELNN